ncbi:MAG: hypothetical protein GY944_03675, partial [bacterium]|nr:hypothetical protein [bacterium]
MHLRALTTISSLIAFAAFQAPAEALRIGDVIKLDLSDRGDEDGGSLADWNRLSSTKTIAAGSVIRHGDGAELSGVTIELRGHSGHNNDRHAAAWPGLGTDPYYIAAADDLVFSVPGPLSVTFAGLDPSFNYQVRVYSLIDENKTPIDIEVTDGARSIWRRNLDRSELWNTVPLSTELIFESVASDAQGRVRISIDSRQALSAEAIILRAVTPSPTAKLRRQRAAAAGQQAVVAGSMKGRDGLLARPLMGRGDLPRRLMGVGVDVDGTIYVSATARQMREEVSLLQSRFLQALDMGFTRVAEKRSWLMQNYSPKIAKAQRMPDLNGDGLVDTADLVLHSEKIFTLQDTDKDGIYDAATLFADGFNDIVTGVAHSVTPIAGDVYATIIPDLWKLTDTDGDGHADRRTSLAHGFAPHLGYGNHDLHSVLQAYDGKIYWSMGDRGVNVVRQDGQRVAYPHTGAILRCNPDGSDFEVFASGLRNCQYFDFDAYGNLFSIDHDADFQGEQERLVYIPEGSDAGWRNYYQYRHSNRVLRDKGRDLYSPWLSEVMWKPLHNGQPAHFLPPLENSWNAPAAFSFQPGTALGGKYHNHFLLGGMGVIRAFEMVPDGASFRRKGADQVIGGLSSQVLASTFAPDGRLYFVLWQPKRNGPLWALADGNAPKCAVDAMAEVEARLRHGFGSEPLTTLLASLGHADRRIRQGAQFELVARRATKDLRKLVRNPEAARLPRLHSLWALGQLEHRDRSLLQQLSTDSDQELRAQTARWAGELRFDPDKVLLKLLRDAAPRVQALAAIAVGKLQHRAALQALTDLLATADNKVPVLRHAGISGLVGSQTTQHLQTLAMHPSVAVRIAAVVALRRRRETVALIPALHDASPQVTAEAVRAIYDEATPASFAAHPESLEAVAALLHAEHDTAVNVRALAA